MRENCSKLLCRGNEDGFRARWPHWGTLQVLLLVSKTPADSCGFQAVWHQWTCTVCFLHWLFLPEGTRSGKTVGWKAWCHMAETTQRDFCHGRSLKCVFCPSLSSSLILLSLFYNLCHASKHFSKISSNPCVKPLDTDWVVCVGEWLQSKFTLSLW